MLRQKCPFTRQTAVSFAIFFPTRFAWNASGYFSRTWFKCSHMVVKPPLYCTRKCGCKCSVMSACSRLQPPCNGSTGQVPRTELLKTIAIHRNTHVHLLARRIPSQGMSWTVECPLNYFGIKFHMADVVDDLALRAQEVFTAQQDKKVMKKLKLCKCAKTCQYCSH